MLSDPHPAKSCNPTQGFGAAEQKKEFYLHSQTYYKAYVPDPFALDRLRARDNLLVRCPFKQDKSRAKSAKHDFRQKSDTKPVAPAHPTSADNWGPHELLRRKTVMEIAMAAHATNPNEPNIKIVSPYPGRLLKARLRRIQKEPKTYGPRIELCAGIRVKKEGEEEEKRQFTRVGLSTRVRKHVQDHKSRVIRHFLEDQSAGNLDDASIADSVSLYKQRRMITEQNPTMALDEEQPKRGSSVPGQNSPNRNNIEISTKVEFVENDSSDIEQYQINYLPDINQ
ncbi:uncharacterized protein LOC142342321 isoform X2 [Convolutriloba macropyga]|uniref:uncharacterized protein LOC142342321 isoform X2 n=1 Tax=Convolutriloba macropyga TaxID=536237 RepID=UPI003F5245C0